MWSISKLKKKGWSALKKNYWRILGISLLAAFIAGGMRVTGHLDSAAAYFVGGRFEVPTNADIVNDWMTSVKEVANGYGEQNGEGVLAHMGENYTPKKGILAKVYNQMTADRSVLYGFMNALNDLVFKNRFGQGAIILAGVGLLLAVLIFGSNVLQVGKCRFMLESHTYPNSRFDRVLFPWRVKKWKNVSLIMFERSLFVFLWDFTIVGGIIKRYSYKMVPYILAENPEIGHSEAFQLSRQMMRGNKWRAFLLDLSFIGWRALSILTMGILKWVFIQPYLEMVYAGLYLELRREAKETQMSLAHYMNDEALEMETDKVEYPVEEHPLYNPDVKGWIKADYHRKYSLWSVILMFFTFSFIGWAWEVSLHLFGDGVFVNRGFFHGPWLPIYGTGGVLIIVLMRRLADRPLLAFTGIVTVCGIVEYVAAWILWEMKEMYWWNYTGYFLNLHGRICAEGLLVFGLGGCAILYLLAPVLDELFQKIPKKIVVIVCVVLLSIFAVDAGYSMVNPNSGAGITDYEH